jgi:hypothetical protein
MKRLPAGLALLSLTMAGAPGFSMDYCSMENGCPTDKCFSVANCKPGGVECIGTPTCIYKDPALKEKYYEVPFKKAMQCLNDFVTKHAKEYPGIMLFDLDKPDAELAGLPTIGAKPITVPCSLLLATANDHLSDNFCWHFGFTGKSPALPTQANVLVGAETCMVFWPDLANPIYQLSDPNLPQAAVLVTPGQAAACAESYIVAHKRDYLEYRTFVVGSLHAPEPPQSDTAPRVDVMKDLKSYIVIGKSRAGYRRLKMVVGAHTCTVNAIDEKHYKKLKKS